MTLLGGSWVVLSRVLSHLIWLLNPRIRGYPVINYSCPTQNSLIATHEPRSRGPASSKGCRLGLCHIEIMYKRVRL